MVSRLISASRQETLTRFVISPKPRDASTLRDAVVLAKSSGKAGFSFRENDNCPKMS